MNRANLFYFPHTFPSYTCWGFFWVQVIEVSCTIRSSCKQSINLSAKEQRKGLLLVRSLPMHKRLLLILRPGNCWLQKGYWSLVLWFLIALLSSVKRKKNHRLMITLALVLPGLSQVKHHCKSWAWRYSDRNHRNSRKLLILEMLELHSWSSFHLTFLLLDVSLYLWRLLVF